MRRDLPTLRPRTVAMSALLILATAACGGGGDSPSGPEEPDPGSPPALANGSMSARIDGAAWRASFFVQAQITRSRDGEITNILVTGVDTVGVALTRARQIVITVSRRADPSTGTYPLGATNGGGSYVSLANVVQSASGWATPMKIEDNAGSGTMTIATLTDARIAGTFAFTAAPAPGNPAGDQKTMSVTEGSFDIELTQSP